MVQTKRVKLLFSQDQLTAFTGVIARQEMLYIYVYAHGSAYWHYYLEVCIMNT